MYGQDGKGWKRRCAQQVPLPCQQKRGSSSANLPLVSQSRGWRCRLHNPQGWCQAFDVPAQVLPARASPHDSFCLFFHSLLPPAFPFFSIIRLCLDVGKMEKHSFPPAQLAWYDLTPQFMGKNPPAGSFFLSSQAEHLPGGGGFLGHPSSSSSSSSQLISEGCDSPARLARRRSLPAGCRPAACVFHDRLETMRLVAEKYVVDYRRRRQTPCTLMVLPSRASATSSPSRGGARGSLEHPLQKPSPLSKDREGKCSES